MQTAKLFKTGRSQAVRLPAEFRFQATEVFIRRDRETGDVILSRRPSWKEILDRIDIADVPEDFLSAKERNRKPPREPRI